MGTPLELGQGFAFVGRQVLVKIGNTERFICYYFLFFTEPQLPALRSFFIPNFALAFLFDFQKILIFVLYLKFFLYLCRKLKHHL